MSSRKQSAESDDTYMLEFEEYLKSQEKNAALAPIEDKILFTGLDGSGKTSILKLLKDKLPKFEEIKPTKFAQRSLFNFLNKTLASWDLGGQSKYRIAYLKEPTKFFDRTSVCVYLIDIQDRARVQEALSYLADVVTQFKNLNLSPLIYIFFHKIDPNYRRDQGVHLVGYLAELKDQIRQIISEEFNVFFIETSVFEIWSIITAFSQIMLRLFPQSDLLDKLVSQFVEKHKAEGALVLDQNSLVIAQFYANLPSKQLLQNSTAYFLILSDSLDRECPESNQMIIKRGEKEFTIVQFHVDRFPMPLYFIIYRSKLETPLTYQDIEALTNVLSTIL